MTSPSERRRSNREDFSVPEIGVLYYLEKAPTSAPVSTHQWFPYFIDILNKNQTGVLVCSGKPLETRTTVYLEI